MQPLPLHQSWKLPSFPPLSLLLRHLSHLFDSSYSFSQVTSPTAKDNGNHLTQQQPLSFNVPDATSSSFSNPSSYSSLSSISYPSSSFLSSSRPPSSSSSTPQMVECYRLCDGVRISRFSSPEDAIGFIEERAGADVLGWRCTTTSLLEPILFFADTAIILYRCVVTLNAKTTPLNVMNTNMDPTQFRSVPFN